MGKDIKYLGVVLDKPLIWKKHIKTTIAKDKATTAKLYPLLNRRSQMSIRNKLLLTMTIIRPTLAYASTAWGYAAGCHLNRLQATENNLLRMAIDAPRFVRNSQIYRHLEWVPLREFPARKAKADFEKAGKRSNEELRNLLVRIQHYPGFGTLGVFANMFYSSSCGENKKKYVIGGYWKPDKG
ncbi:hypothetical protein YQE_03302, partial [Dendroctonus ponderosae]